MKEKTVMSKIEMGKGQQLYVEAKKVIPGGTQLLSKRPECYLPDLWPSYYSRAKGCRIWDLDGREYIDMDCMGVGACVHGYANDEIDSAACEAISNGGMSTLNAPEEVYLAEELLKIHKWAGGVRYTKTGGESMALATRIARAYTKKDIILFCGYHGWHDWYLSANLTNKNALNDQHIAGLEPLGVPSGLAGTNLPFHYNNIEEFTDLLKKHEGKIAAVVMEPIRNDYPKDDFLRKIREATTEAGIVLIFDEITAGFRLCVGGSHIVLGVEPDIAVFAKAMTNGYPLAAIIGRKNVMDAAQETFISSTFFTERIGLAAALKSVRLYQENRIWEKQIKYGELVRKGWKMAADDNGLEIEIGGIVPLSHFSIKGKENALIYQTYFTQEMLKRGYIASTSFYASYAHSKKVIDEYLRNVNEVFRSISILMYENAGVESVLDSSICHGHFGRLN